MLTPVGGAKPGPMLPRGNQWPPILGAGADLSIALQ